MPKAISDATISELSLVFAHKDGLEWAPRNPDAKVLMVKSAAKKPTFFERLLQKAGVFPVSADVEDSVDNDGDGADDYNEIVQNVCALYYDLQAACQIHDENARSMAIKIAIDGFKEEFMEMCAGNEDEAEEKAGARHSAADKSAIDAIGEHAANAKGMADKMQGHVDKLKSHVDAMVAAHGQLTASTKDQTAGEDPNDDSEDGTVADATAAKKRSDAAAGKAAAVVDAPDEKAKKDDKPADKPYGDVEYADPKNGKYPIETAAHAKAALSYLSMPKNAAEYSASELATVMGKIKAACKKFGIEVADDKAAPVAAAEPASAIPAATPRLDRIVEGVVLSAEPVAAVAEPVPAATIEQPPAAPEPTNKGGAVAEKEIDMTAEEISAIIADAATKAAEATMKASAAQIDALNLRIAKQEEAAAIVAAAGQKSIDEIKAKAAVAEAEVIAAKAESEAAKAEARKAQEAAKSVGVAAQRPTASSYTTEPEPGEETILYKKMKAHMVVNRQSHTFGHSE